MKIVHVVRMNNEGDIGGVEYHVRYLTKAQLNKGLEPVLVTFSLGQEDKLETYTRDDVPWHQLTIKKKPTPLYDKLKRFEGKGIGLLIMLFERIQYNFYYQKVLDLIVSMEPDIVHQHDYLPSVSLSKQLCQRYPTVFTNHFGEYLYLDKSFLTRWLQRKFIRPFHQIIAPSKELLPSREGSIHIANGYDDEKFTPLTQTEQDALKRDLKCEGKVVFLCARRWAPTKGILYFAQSLNLLPPDVKSKVVVLFAGNESTDYEMYKSQVSAELAKAGDCDIRLLGNLDHSKLVEYMQLCDVAVIPSLMEAISLFAIESLGSGKPVLATDTGGLPEVIKPNKNGWLVPKANAAALAKAITSIVQNAPDSIFDIDTKYYQENFSWRSIADRVSVIYENAKKQKAGES